MIAKADAKNRTIEIQENQVIAPNRCNRKDTRIT